MSSKYLLIMCYECEISVSVHSTEEEVKTTLEKFNFCEKEIDKIMYGDTYNDLDDHGQVKVQRIDV